MAKLIHCYPSNGMMWCKFPNGKNARPFPLLYTKIPPKDKSKGGIKKS